MIKKTKYIIISPVRDEGKYIEQTLKSVINQTLTPTEWIIVNDGSTDNTGKIIDAYAKQHSWILSIHRKNRGYRKAGGGVIEAFYEGYNAINSTDWHFIVKLDGDLSFESNYFEKCFEKFREAQNLGITGGGIYHNIDGEIALEKNPIFHVRGATKIYKKECWIAIGGLLQAPGWDTLDEVKANMLGWKTLTFPELIIIHHRITGKANGIWLDAVKNGTADYISGYHPLFMFAKCIKRIPNKPLFVSSLGHFYGFAMSYLKRVPRVSDQDLINYLRKQQMRRLFFMDSIWR